MDMKKTLGQKLRELREQRGWTQLYAAKIFGITNGALSNYERDERMPDAKMLKKFAEVYEVSLDYLLDNEPTEKSTDDIIGEPAGMKIKSIIGERIKELREKQGLTQKELATFLGISDRAVGYYEKEERTPPPDMLQKIADFFDVSVDYLLGRTDLPNAYIPEEYKQKYKISKRDIRQYEEAMQRIGEFFMDNQVAEEDKEKMFRDLSDMFWKAKEINKQKYGRKKKKA